MKKKDGSGLYVDFDFKYDDKSHEENYTYEIPFDVACDGIRKYFESKDIKLDGKNTDIWNTLGDFGDVIDNVISEDDSFIDYCKEKCKDDAFAEYKEQYEYENDLEEDISNNDDSQEDKTFSKEELEKMAWEAIDKVSHTLIGYDITEIQYTHTSGPMSDYGDTGEKSEKVPYTFDYENAEIIVDEDEERYSDKEDESITSLDIEIKSYDENGNQGDDLLYASMNIDWSSKPTKETIVDGLVKQLKNNYNLLFTNL